MSSRLRFARVGQVMLSILAALLVSAAVDPAAAQAERQPGCASEGALLICVRSAALSVVKQYGDSFTTLRADVVLEVVNTSDFPIDIAFVKEGGIWSFTPQNSPSIGGNSLDITGVSTCSRSSCGDMASRGQFTTLGPRVGTRIQMSLRDDIEPNGLPLMQAASIASLSGLISVVDRGKQRVVPLPIGEFPFGNGLARWR